MKYMAMAGLLCAIAAGILAGVLYEQVQTQREEARILQQQTQQTQQELQKLNDELAELRVHMAEQSRAPATGDEQAGIDGAAMLKGLLGGLSGDREGAGSNPFAALLDAVQSDEGEGGAAANPFAEAMKLFGGEGEMGDAGGMMKAVGKLMASEAGGEFMNSMIESQVLEQYAPMFEQLNLSPELEQQVRDIYLRQAREGAAQAMNIFSGDMDMEKMMADAEAQEATRRAELAKVLSPAQMAQVDAFEEELPLRTMSNMYRQQLRMAAPALSPELIEMSANVMAQELVSVPEETPISEQTTQQQAAMDRALAALETQLDEEQYQQVERFVEQQAQMGEWALRMFGGGAEGAGQ